MENSYALLYSRDNTKWLPGFLGQKVISIGQQANVFSICISESCSVSFFYFTSTLRDHYNANLVGLLLRVSGLTFSNPIKQCMSGWFSKEAGEKQIA